MNDYQTPLPTAAIAEKVAAFVDQYVIPLETRFLEAGYAAIATDLDAAREQARRLGLWTPSLPVSYGGLGLSLREYAPVSAVLGHSPLGHFALNSQAPDIGNMELLAEFGTTGQKQEFLEPLARGELRSCFTMTEPEFAGSNPLHMGTTARRDGDDYIINGNKWFATSADGADFAIAMVLTEPDQADLHRRASLIIVPAATPGFHHVGRIRIMGDEGDGPFSHSEIRYENCRVPASNLIGEPGSGFRLAQFRLGPGRIHHCMRWIGICERAFDMMCSRAASRELAPGRPLASQQTIQNWIAESRTEIDAARLLVLETASQIDAQGSIGARREISQIKFYVAGLMQRVLDQAIQVHGAAGLTETTLLSHWFRHERGARIYDGPDEVHKSLVARLVLRSYGASQP